MYADGADQPFHSLPDLIGDKYVLEMSELTEVVMKDDVMTLWVSNCDSLSFLVYVCRMQDFCLK